MKKQLFRAALLGVAATFGLQAGAVPAKPGLLQRTTSDGTVVNVRIVGDENYHQCFSEDGYPLMERDGNFYFVNFDATGNMIDSRLEYRGKADRSDAAKAFLKNVDLATLDSRIQKRAARSTRNLARAAAQAKAKMAPARLSDCNDGPPFEKGYGLFSDARFPAYGDQKAIVILVEYADVKFSSKFAGGMTAHDYFSRMLNEDGFSAYGATGCAAEYFRLNSGDTFRPVFDVYGPVTLSRNRAYYGGNDAAGNDKNAPEMIKEACDLLNAEVDFGEYDRNHDGMIDNVFVFYAGQGEASGGPAESVWPHSFEMSNAGYSPYQVNYDGVRLESYACTNELVKGRPDGVGTFIHEFSHVMGLPDLYSTNYSGAFTPGYWSAMDYGPYNNSGMTPPLYSAFERYALGWMKPREINEAVSATLPHIIDNVAGIIHTEKTTEYFLFENRQQESWDKYLPGHGMLVWHVDYNKNVFDSNSPNNTASHQHVDLVEADDIQSASTRTGDTFPGAAGRTSFTSSTSPALRSWSGKGIDLPITGITEKNGLITFDVLGGKTMEKPVLVVNEPVEVTPVSVTLSWNNLEGYDAHVSVYTKNPEGKTEHVSGFRLRNVGQVSSVKVEDLEPSSDYYYSVMLSKGWVTTDMSPEKKVTTAVRTLDYTTVKALEADEVKATSFRANWEKLADANAYTVTIYDLIMGEPYKESLDFSSGIYNIGKWYTDARQSYEMAAYCGEAAPSLRMATGNVLASPVFDDDVTALRFWTRGNNTREGDVVNVYTEADGQRTLHTSVPVVKTVGGKKTEITDFPAGTRQVVIEFVRAGTSGALALDDVVVEYGHQYTVNEQSARDLKTGDVTSHVVTGLTPGAMYGYRVVGTDGKLNSIPSEMITVKTAGGAGVDAVTDGSPLVISVNSLSVSVGDGQEVVAYDLTGGVVASGRGSLVLPASGVYIVRAANKSAKVAVR